MVDKTSVYVPTHRHSISGPFDATLACVNVNPGMIGFPLELPGFLELCLVRKRLL
jgi:hypothetical protein